MIQNIKMNNMAESQKFFSRMVDELVELSEYDSELAHGIKWIDAQAQKRGITFYDMVFEILYKHNNKQSNQWFSTQN